MIRGRKHENPDAIIENFAPEFAKNQMEEKALLFEHPNYQAVPAKYKLLIGIAAAAIAGSETCTEMWVKMAKDRESLTQRLPRR